MTQRAKFMAAFLIFFLTAVQQPNASLAEKTIPPDETRKASSEAAQTFNFLKDVFFSVIVPLATTIFAVWVSIQMAKRQINAQAEQTAGQTVAQMEEQRKLATEGMDEQRRLASEGMDEQRKLATVQMDEQRRLAAVQVEREHKQRHSERLMSQLMFLAPFLAISQQSEELYRQFALELDRDPSDVFMKNADGEVDELAKDTAKIDEWKKRMTDIFLPLNESQERLVLRQSVMIDDEEYLNKLLQLLKHISEFRVVLMRWNQSASSVFVAYQNIRDNEGPSNAAKGTMKAKTSYPDRLVEHTQRIVDKLQNELKQLRDDLEGRSVQPWKPNG